MHAKTSVSMDVLLNMNDVDLLLVGLLSMVFGIMLVLIVITLLVEGKEAEHVFPFDGIISILGQVCLQFNC